MEIQEEEQQLRREPDNLCEGGGGAGEKKRVWAAVRHRLPDAPSPAVIAPLYTFPAQDQQLKKDDQPTTSWGMA